MLQNDSYDDRAGGGEQKQGKEEGKGREEREGHSDEVGHILAGKPASVRIERGHHVCRSRRCGWDPHGTGKM